MHKKKFDTEKFKALLDNEYSWPAHYTFKFIIPRNNLDALKEVFERDDLKTKVSKKGTYISVTVEKYVISSEEIMTIYEECAEIDGLISL